MKLVMVVFAAAHPLSLPDLFANLMLHDASAPDLVLDSALPPNVLAEKTLLWEPMWGINS